MNKAVFLDRDGVINFKRDDYVKNVDEFVMITGAAKAIKLLNDNNFLVIIITNQSAVNRKLVTHDMLESIHVFMKNQLEREGAFIDGLYYCPHRPDEDCECRKPKPGLILDAIKDHNILPGKSWFIGDSETDMIAAKSAGLATIKMKENGSLLDTVKNMLYNQNQNGNEFSCK